MITAFVLGLSRKIRVITEPAAVQIPKEKSSGTIQLIPKMLRQSVP
jgi:hypothetical protein